MRLLASTTLMSALLLLLSACTNIKYADDYKSGTDFSGLKTYNWRAISVDIGGIDKTVLQKIADEQFRAQGFMLADTSAELLIGMQVFARASTAGNTSIGIGIGLPVGRNGSIGLGTGHLLDKGKQEGVIVIDITQTSSNQLNWPGNAEGIPRTHFSFTAEQTRLEPISKLLPPFPPHTACQ